VDIRQPCDDFQMKELDVLKTHIGRVVKTHELVYFCTVTDVSTGLPDWKFTKDSFTGIVVDVAVEFSNGHIMLPSSLYRVLFPEGLRWVQAADTDFV